jgi:carbon-monoxide dehydrogenase large subunit
VGGALYERMAYDEHGQLLNASFMDFLMPYVTEVPRGIDIDHLETPSPLNPLGIKGVGEAGVIPSSAVFASAIEDAEGIPITSMPISPSELFELRRRHHALTGAHHPAAQLDITGRRTSEGIRRRHLARADRARVAGAE